MTPIELVATIATPVATVIGSLLSLNARLARQDVQLEYLARAVERAERRSTGSDPPPRPKLITLTKER